SGLTATGGDGNYTFAVVSGSLPDGLSLNTSTGAITGTPTKAGTFSFQVSVHDGTGTAAGTTTTSCTITIIPANLTVTCSAAIGTQDIPYNSRLNVTGGLSPFHFSITAGSLPPGLALDATTGIISGKPTAAGTYSFTAQVTDSTGGTAQVATTDCTIVIKPPITVTCPGVTAFVNLGYTSALTVVGGTNQFTFEVTSGSLPPGVTLNPTTGAISGTPTQTGAYSFTITVTDRVTGAAASPNCTITVYAPPTLACMPASQWVMPGSY